jgi:hypothetical protein
MILGNRIFVNEHFGSGARRDFIRVEFEKQTFPSTENKKIEGCLNQLKSISGNIDFFCLGENEKPLLTEDGLFLCASGKVSIDTQKNSAFSHYEISLDEKIWRRFRVDAMGNYTKNLLIYFSHLHGRIDSSDENFICLKIKLAFEKIVWCIKS